MKGSAAIAEVLRREGVEQVFCFPANPLIDAAAAAGADVLLTSDLKHHFVSERQQSAGPALCDVAHFASEWPWLPVAAEVLGRDLSGRVQVAVSRRRTDPWAWHVGQGGDPAAPSVG